MIPHIFYLTLYIAYFRSYLHILEQRRISTWTPLLLSSFLFLYQRFLEQNSFFLAYSHSISHPVLQRRGHHAGWHQRWLDDLGHRGHALLERRHAEDQDSGGNLYRQQIHGHAEVRRHKVKSLAYIYHTMFLAQI